MGTSQHSPGNRALMEAVLRDRLPWIAARCSAWNIEFNRWPYVREIAVPVQSEAWQRITDDLVSSGMSVDAAEHEAAERLWLEVSALRSRRERAKQQAIRGAA